MPLTWNQLSDLTGSTGGSRSPDADDSTHPANVLLQIVLPIVLILAFLIVVRMQALEQKEREATVLMHKMKGEHRGEVLADHIESLIELQRQKLIVELQKIEAAKKLLFGVDVFSSVNLGPEGDTAVKHKYKQICAMTFLHLGTPGAKHDLAEQMYDTVLEAAGIRDQSLFGSESKFSILTDSTTILQDNSDFLTQQIEEFISQLEASAQQSQYEAVGATLEFYGSNNESLENLNPDFEVLRRDYRDSATPENAARIYNCVVSTISNYLEREGFNFFRDTWAGILEI